MASVAAEQQDPEGQVLISRLRILNLVAAASMISAGVLRFVILTLDISALICAVYVILFGILLIGYETHLKFVWRILRRQLALLLKWKGRVAFLFFVSTLCFGLSWIGYIFGGVGLFAVAVNIYAMVYYPGLHSTFDHQEEYLSSGAQKPSVSVNQDLQSSIGPASSLVENEQPPAPAASPDDWKEVLDPETGNKYFLNKRTGKTAWSMPGES